MSTVLLAATGLVIVAATARAYLVTRDALHPLIYLGPMLFYQYVMRPWVLVEQGTLERLFSDERLLTLVLTVDLAGVALFCGGCLVGIRGLRGRTPLSEPANLTPAARQQLFRIACLLGCLAVASFVWMAGSPEGLWRAFSHAKGGVRAASGYVSEATLLGFPAVVILALSRAGRGLRSSHWMLILAFLGPQLLDAFLGTRRGPAFRVLATLALVWLLAYGRRPSLIQVLTCVAAVGTIVVFLFANRPNIYLGSDFNLNTDSFYDVLLPKDAGEGDEFVVSAGSVAMAAETGRCYWGARYFAMYFIRPIPKQIWPTKYEDMGVGWVKDQPGSGGFTDDEWSEVLGWRPLRGSSAGFVSDLFLEASWGALALCWLFGRFFGYLWAQASLKKGLWVILYIQAAVLSVYVPAQSVSALGCRFLFMCVPMAILWKLFVSKWMRSLHAKTGRPAYVRVRSGALIESRKPSPYNR